MLYKDTTINWKNNYGESRLWFEKHGHFPTAKENRRLRQWANTWYRKFGKNEPELLQMLLDIGFQIPNKWNLWNANYAAAQEFFNKNGRALKYRDNPKLFRYFRVWMGHSGKKNPDRIEMLKEIGFNVKQMENVWNKNYEKAETFFKKNGRFPTRKDNIILAEWANLWYKNFGNEQTERLEMMAKIGFTPNNNK